MGSDPRSDEWRYPEGDEPTPPAPAMPDGARPVRREVLAGEAAELLLLRIRDAEHAAELTTLRQRLAEAEARAEDFKRIGQGFERDMRKHFQQSCDNLQRAEKAQADAARWEGAARDLYTALKDFADGECHCDESERECVQCCATKALATASAIVRDGGGAS